MRLVFRVMTSDEVHWVSFGRVGHPAYPKAEDAAAPVGTPWDPRVFGPEVD